MPEHQKVYCMCEAWIARGEAVFDGYISEESQSTAADPVPTCLTPT